MRVDMFRRSENDGHYSYLAVPQGREIPGEAANTDWEVARKNFELTGTSYELTGLKVDDAEKQIDDKGYAISSIKHLGEPWPDNE